MVTHFAGKSWETMCQPVADGGFDFEKAGKRCGMLQTIDNSIPIEPSNCQLPIEIDLTTCTKTLLLDDKRGKRFKQHAVDVQLPADAVTAAPCAAAAAVAPDDVHDDSDDDIGNDDPEIEIEDACDEDNEPDDDACDESDRDSDVESVSDSTAEPWNEWLPARHRVDDDGTLDVNSLLLFAVKPDVWLLAKVTAVNN